MSFEALISREVEADIERFWKAAEVWLESPHVVNRRILTTKKLLAAKIDSDNVWQSTSWVQRLQEALRGCENNTNVEQIDWLQALGIKASCNDCSNADVTSSRTTGSYIFLHKLLPRHVDKFSDTLELVIVNKEERELTFISKSIDDRKLSLSVEWPYRIECSNACDRISISLEKNNNNETNSSTKWLKEQFFPRFVKWLSLENNSNSLTTGSLKLVSAEKYVILYNELKKKYGYEMVKIWPENTDPAKFVYEDVAIAAYLLLLWEEERKLSGTEEKQSFLDLGCGNGLLVHILASEGHPGIGIDLRKRNIWDLYPKSTQLEVRTIVPSASSLFPETDWLIGNHSDELTPWIPVIAARSSYRCRFFLLPCCAYEFDGRKYQRDVASKSQYLEYMDYVRKISERCGFRVEMDKLRIPSTKRICIVGQERIYSREEEATQVIAIQELINERSQKHKNETTELGTRETSTNEPWSQDFKPRETVERVRNCTKLAKGLVSDIVDVVTKHLLSKVRMIVVGDSDEKWNAGGRVELSEIAKLLSPDTLKELKNECGGLQTLLRNHGNIFQIVQGKVQLKIPSTDGDAARPKKKWNKSEIRRKVKPCWFHQNHPNGCPLVDEKCNYLH